IWHAAYGIQHLAHGTHRRKFLARANHRAGRREVDATLEHRAGPPPGFSRATSIESIAAGIALLHLRIAFYSDDSTLFRSLPNAHRRPRPLPPSGIDHSPHAAGVLAAAVTSLGTGYLDQA